MFAAKLPVSNLTTNKPLIIIESICLIYLNKYVYKNPHIKYIDPIINVFRFIKSKILKPAISKKIKQ